MTYPLTDSEKIASEAEQQTQESCARQQNDASETEFWRDAKYAEEKQISER